MTQADADKLVDELIDVKAERDAAQTELSALETSWSSARDDYMETEVAYMVLKDEYSELARALGFEGDSFWGDPLVSHSDVLARAKDLVAIARVA